MRTTPKNILVAPLNWGLGHATRCIPIIRALEAEGFRPILASDGAALEMLKKEFPHLKSIELPSYEITYAKNGRNFKWKMIAGLPKMVTAILNEKRTVNQWISEHQLDGIISDNRLGVRSKKIPSVFITHQLNVLTGNTSKLTSEMHQFIIKKFHECWVPDFEKKPNLTGKLGHLKKTNLKIKYIGPLSRIRKLNIPQKYDLMVILSGPEPQRTMLEEKIKTELMQFNGKVVFISGIIEAEQLSTIKDNVKYYNFMNSEQLEKTFNESKLVLCRSGYTTIMDLAQLGKKAFFIPTPGQYEQEYLAKKLKERGIVPFAKQNKFKMENLWEAEVYSGFSVIENTIDWHLLFRLFDGE
ncbi:MAG: glycosyltransferase [Flavobacterium sp.]|nr:glycosyltransferase [Flavobacterium sp.]